MDNLWQQALADVVRAELALADRTAKDAYTALGLSSTAWQTYFKKQSRDIPSRVLLDLADYLGMPLSQLLAKAEARQATLEQSRPASDPIRDQLEAKMTRGGRRQVQQAREEFKGGGTDPSGRARADEDDGRSDDGLTARTA